MNRLAMDMIVNQNRCMNDRKMHGVRSHNAQTLQCGYYCGRTFTCALCDLTLYACAAALTKLSWRAATSK